MEHGNDRGAWAGLAPDGGQHQRLMGQIEAGGGFVQQEAPGLAAAMVGRGRKLAQCAGDVHALAFAARKIHVETAGQIAQPDSVEASRAPPL